MDILPIILYILGSILLVVLIILGIKLIVTIDKVNETIDDVNGKLKSLNGVFSVVDFTTDKISKVKDTIVEYVTSFIKKTFRHKKEEEIDSNE